MKCPKCSAETDDKSQFCSKCGKSLSDEAGSAERFKQSLTSRSGAANVAEEDVWQGTFSPKALYGTWLLCAGLTLAAIGLGAMFIVVPVAWVALVVGLVVLWLYPIATLLYQRLSVHYRLTNQRFFHERGILRRVTDRIEVIDMDDISFEQGLIERMLGVGTIRIASSDQSHPKLVLKGIDDVKKVAAQIDDVRRAERLRRGVFVESV